MLQFIVAELSLRWKLQVSDPDLWSWLITLFYLIAFALNLKFISNLNVINKKNDKKLYFLSASLLFFTGLNKQLDLHVLLNELASKTIQKFSLGAYKLTFFWVIIIFTASAVIFVSRLLYLKRDNLHLYTKKMLLGVLLLCSFCVGKFAIIYIEKFNKNFDVINFIKPIKLLETIALITLIVALLELITGHKHSHCKLK